MLLHSNITVGLRVRRTQASYGKYILYIIRASVKLF